MCCRICNIVNLQWTVLIAIARRWTWTNVYTDSRLGETHTVQYSSFVHKIITSTTQHSLFCYFYRATHDMEQQNFPRWRVSPPHRQHRQRHLRKPNILWPTHCECSHWYARNSFRSNVMSIGLRSAVTQFIFGPALRFHPAVDGAWWTLT